jgi:hypothetical protein
MMQTNVVHHAHTVRRVRRVGCSCVGKPDQRALCAAHGRHAADATSPIKTPAKSPAAPADATAASPAKSTASPSKLSAAKKATPKRHKAAYVLRSATRAKLARALLRRQRRASSSASAAAVKRSPRIGLTRSLRRKARTSAVVALERLRRVYLALAPRSRALRKLAVSSA